MKKRSFLSALLAASLVLAGCGTSTADSTTETTASTEAAETTEAEADTTDAELTTLTVGASSTPHAEILEAVRDVLAESGYDLNIVIYDDYVLPNTALADGELDANYFQHTPYLESFNESNGTDIVAAVSVHYEPFGIYGNGVTDLSTLAEGATIVIPADDTNETRALLLLQQENLITLPEGANAIDGVTTLDIVEDNGYNVVAVNAETVAAQLSNSDEGSIAVINGNYALAAGYVASEDALALEASDGDAAQTYANIVAVRAGEESTEKTQALVDALTSDTAKQFIEETYKGSVVAIF